jgi:hypothetical protein
VLISGASLPTGTADCHDTTPAAWLTNNFRFFTTKSTKNTKGSFILPNFVFFALFVVKSSLMSLSSLQSLTEAAASPLDIGYS